MIDLYRCGTDPFLDEEISVDERVADTTEHLGRRTQAPLTGTGLSAEIAATGTLLTALGGTIGSEQVKLGRQKARTAATANFRALRPHQISKIDGGVLAIFGQNAPEISQFFAQGREVFGVCEDAELGGKLTAMRDAVVDHQTANPGSISKDSVNVATALVTDWNLRFGAATTGRAQTATQAEQRRAASLALRTQDFKNLPRIASIFAGELAADGRALSEVKIEFYCPQHLLGKPLGGSSGSGGDGPPPIPQATLSLAVESGVYPLTMGPEGLTLFNVYERAPGGEEFVLVASDVATGHQITKSAGSGEWGFQAAGVVDGVEGPRSAIATAGV